MASVEIMLRFNKEKDRDKKNKKAAFTVAWMKFLLNFQAQKTTQERIIVEKFSPSAPSNYNGLLVIQHFQSVLQHFQSVQSRQFQISQQFSTMFSVICSKLSVNWTIFSVSRINLFYSKSLFQNSRVELV